MTKKLLVIGLFLLGASGLSAQDLYIGQFNIRNDNTKDAAAGNGWATRCPVVCDILKVESFDIFGTQEVLHNQLEDLLAALPDYEYVGVGRNDGMTEGEYAAIFYKTDRVKCLSSGHFWLSETPEVVGSKGCKISAHMYMGAVQGPPERKEVLDVQSAYGSSRCRCPQAVCSARDGENQDDVRKSALYSAGRFQCGSVQSYLSYDDGIGYVR